MRQSNGKIIYNITTKFYLMHGDSQATILLQLATDKETLSKMIPHHYLSIYDYRPDGISLI